MSELIRSMDAIKVELEAHFRITCPHCGADYDRDEDDRTTAALALYEEGWRYAESKQFTCLCLICPVCASGATDKDDSGESDWVVVT